MTFFILPQLNVSFFPRFLFLKETKVEQIWWKIELCYQKSELVVRVHLKGLFTDFTWGGGPRNLLQLKGFQILSIPVAT